MFFRLNLGKHSEQFAAKAAGYSTWDPRKSQGQNGPTYDEIPYGDGPGPRGPIPDVPQHYAQVPAVPTRQGGYMKTNKKIWFGDVWRVW